MMDLEGLRKLNQNKVTHCKPTYSHKPSISHNLFLQAIYFTYFHKQFISLILTSNLFHIFSQAIYFTYYHKQFISLILTSNLFHIFSQAIYFTYYHKQFISHILTSNLFHGAPRGRAVNRSLDHLTSVSGVGSSPALAT